MLAVAGALPASCNFLVTIITVFRNILHYAHSGCTNPIHFHSELLFMAYVITDNCIKDALCVDVCPTDCIHPKKDEPEFEAATQMFIDPAGCIDCGACVPACTSDSIYTQEDLPDDKKQFAEANAAHFA